MGSFFETQCRNELIRHSARLLIPKILSCTSAGTLTKLWKTLVLVYERPELWRLCVYALQRQSVQAFVFSPNIMLEKFMLILHDAVNKV